jgi:predicted transcriptional regulator
VSTVTIHFEQDQAEADRQSLARLLEADARYNRGEHVEAEEHITFESIEGLFALLTPKRLELLRHLHRYPARSIKSLAETIGREYRRVHDDVAALSQIGLIERRGTALRAPHSEIRFALRLDQPAAA